MAARKEWMGPLVGGVLLGVALRLQPLGATGQEAGVVVVALMPLTLGTQVDGAVPVRLRLMRSVMLVARLRQTDRQAIRLQLGFRSAGMAGLAVARTTVSLVQETEATGRDTAVAVAVVEQAISTLIVVQVGMGRMGSLSYIRGSAWRQDE